MSRRSLGVGIVLVVLIGLNAAIYTAVAELSDRTLRVSVLNIGQGDAMLIQSPTGRRILIDGGPDRSILSELGAALPYFGREIDVLVVTNPDKDHFAGFLPVLDRYEVHQVLEPGTRSGSDTYKAFRSKAAEQSIPDTIARKGMILHLGGGAMLTVLAPDHDVSGEKTNDGSLVMHLSYGNNSMLFTGDAPSSVEELLVTEDPDGLTSDVLKVGHHGSRTSTAPEFVAAVNPTYAVISSGKGNSYGHPHKEVLQTLEAAGVTVFRTDRSGRITLRSDGDVWEITTEKQ